MVVRNDVPFVNREIRRKVERYAKKHNLSFIDAYNKLYNTSYRGIVSPTYATSDNVGLKNENK